MTNNFYKMTRADNSVEFGIIIEGESDNWCICANDAKEDKFTESNIIDGITTRLSCGRLIETCAHDIDSQDSDCYYFCSFSDLFVNDSEKADQLIQALFKFADWFAFKKIKFWLD